MKILIVDDSRAMRMIVRRALRQAGYGAATVQEAENGAEALVLARSFAPSLIFCDWNMPVMGGYELLQALNKEGLVIPFGFVSSEATSEVRALAAAAGARFFIVKPFSADAFADVLSGVFTGSVVVHQLVTHTAAEGAGIVMPNAQTVAETLSGLLGKPVTAMDWRTGPEPGAITVTATFMGDSGLQFLMVADLAFAGCTSGALAMLPEPVVKSALDAKRLPENLVETTREIFNVMARLFVGPHSRQPKLERVYYSPEPLPLEARAAAKAPSAQAHFVVNVPGYGKGRLSGLAK